MCYIIIKIFKIGLFSQNGALYDYLFLDSYIMLCTLYNHRFAKMNERPAMTEKNKKPSFSFQSEFKTELLYRQY